MLLIPGIFGFINTEACPLLKILRTAYKLKESVFVEYYSVFFPFSERKDQIYSIAFPKPLISCLLHFPSY